MDFGRKSGEGTDVDVHEELFIGIAFDVGCSGVGGCTRQNGLESVVV